MKIVKWLSPSNSSINGHALVRVESNEVADIEEMLKLVDGDSIGQFGFHVKIVKTGEEMPKIRRNKLIGEGYYEAEEQFGFVNASNIRKEVRYYNVFVNRD